MDLRIAGRVALVCGSSSGLGRAIAVALATEGCRVAVNGRHQGRLDRAVEQVRRDAASNDVEGFRADVSLGEEADALVEQVRHRFGAVDILVCNAGGPPSAPFAEIASETWRAALELSLLSTVRLCRRAVPLMLKRQWGRIVCLTSVAAKQPLSGLMLSTTARAGVLGFAKSLADELAPDGITVNCVCPGYMRTDRVEELMQSDAERLGRDTKDVLADLIADIPVGRMGEPHELGAAVAFLASEPARYITGAVLQIDGGFVRSIF